MPAPRFPLHTLPKEIRNWVEDRADVTGADPTGIAMAALVNLSGALSHTVSVLKPKKYDEWYVSGLLWVMLVGDVSSMKTPIISAATSPLRKLNADRYAEWKERVCRQLGDDFFTRKQTKADREAFAKIEPPIEYVINDTTVEALSDTLKHQNRGILMVRDEIFGWIGQMERYQGKASGYDRALWLEAYNGGPYSIKRISRGTVYVHNWSCSILGGVQPNRLLDAGDLAVDGMLARFLPVMIRRGELDRDIPRDPDVLSAYTKLFRELDNIGERVVLLSEEGRQIRERVVADLHALSASADQRFAAYAGKLGRAWCALALLLHMVEVAQGRVGATDEVPAATAECATAIIGYFLASGRMFYDWLIDPTGEENRRIAYVIMKHPESVIEMRTFRQNKLSFSIEGRIGAYRSLEPFVSGGWLTPERPGPDNLRWKIAPGLHERYTEPFTAYQTAMRQRRQQFEDTMKRHGQ